jgi:uncharacterized protein YcfJ
MQKVGLTTALLAMGLATGGCATTDRYGYENRNNSQLGRVATGAAVGAAAGAAVGGAVGGVSVGEGAAAGAAAGALVGALTSNNNRRWYRDQYGRCYHVDSRGDRVYDDRQTC